MTYYELTAELLAPLLIQENRQSSVSSGLTYLPGSSLRGALASTYLRRGGAPEDSAFKMLFLDNPVAFPDLLPTTEFIHSWPIPTTAYSCKRVSGFKSEGKHGVGDALASVVVKTIASPVIINNLCGTCSQDVKPYHGFWNGDVTQPRSYHPVMIYQRHTGIDRHTGTVASSIFFITQGMADSQKATDEQHHPQYLTGGVYLTEDQFKEVKELTEDSLFVGADRTRGMGELKISLKPGTAPNFDIKSWSQGFVQKMLQLNPAIGQPGRYFSIGLISHTILVDEFLRPSFELTLDFQGIHSVAKVIHETYIRGWQSSWRLPKVEDVALERGSVFVFRYDGSDFDGLAAYLGKLVIEGIGLRREEGFGQIRVCDPLHYQEVI